MLSVALKLWFEIIEFCDFRSLSGPSLRGNRKRDSVGFGCLLHSGQADSLWLYCLPGTIRDEVCSKHISSNSQISEKPRFKTVRAVDWWHFCFYDWWTWKFPRYPMSSSDSFPQTRKELRIVESFERYLIETVNSARILSRRFVYHGFRLKCSIRICDFSSSQISLR